MLLQGFLFLSIPSIHFRTPSCDHVVTRRTQNRPRTYKTHWPLISSAPLSKMYQDLEEGDSDKNSWDEGFDEVSNISLDGDVVSVYSRDSYGSFGSFPNEVELKFAPVLETVVEEEEEDDEDDGGVEKLATLHPKFSKYMTESARNRSA